VTSGGTADTFILVHGAGSDAWHWHLVAPRLQAAGCQVVGVDLPVDDERCGLAEYLEVVRSAIPAWCRPIVVAQSMAALTAPLVAACIPVSLIVLVAPMVPAPGETPGQWWQATGQAEAARRCAVSEGRDPDAPFDAVEAFLHDVEPDVVAAAEPHVRIQADRPFGDMWPLDGWPEVPTRVVIGRRDRLFPLEFQRRVVSETLGIMADEIDAGHLRALARPAELSQLLLRYRTEVLHRQRARDDKMRPGRHHGDGTSKALCAAAIAAHLCPDAGVTRQLDCSRWRYCSEWT
jgi:pimeloyl-ACP methyl ester carboxylesterase